MTAKLLTVRTGTTADAAEIRRVHIAASKGPDSLERDNQNVLAWLDSRVDADYLQEMERDAFVIAETDDGRMIGFGAIDLGKANINSVYTDPEFTRQGVASALVAAMENLAKDAGIDKVTLQAAGGALTFYYKQGFEYVTEPPKDGPLWAEMKKVL